MLAPQLEEIITIARDQDEALVSQRLMLDRTFDLHNDLTDWAADTQHAEAAAQIMAILEKYAGPTYAKDLTIPLPEELSPSTPE